MKTTNTDFYTALCADLTADECQELRTFRRGGTDDGKPGPRWFGTDPAEIARRARGYPAKLDGYYGINPRKRAADPRDQTGKTADVTRIRFAVADIDFKHFPDGRAGAIAALAAFPLAPTWVIDSGGGLQALWAIVPLVLTGPNDPQIATFQAAQSRLYVALGGLDAVGDIARVFRLPGTHNAKYDPPRPVAIRHHDPDARYTFDDFLAILPEPEPAPARPSWTPPTGRAHAANRDEPTRDDIREWLRWIAPVGDYKDHWLKVLAAVHSVYPGADGVALAEEWSPGKAGEVAEKFASFKRAAGGAGAAGVGTLIYLAQAGGWQPARATRSSMPPGDGADLAAEVSRLRADVARLGDELRARDTELAELREERDFYRRCLDCPDPVIGRAMPVIAEELHRAYRAGSPIVQDGQEFARLNFEEAAAGKAINRGAIRTAADRLGPATPLLPIDAKYNRNGRDMPTKHYYVACPVEERASVARLGLGLLNRAAPQQRHQGRKPPKIMPTAVAAQEAPVRREQIHVEKFFSLRDDTPQAAPLATQTTIVAADYWTAAGEQITQEAGRDWQVAHGVRAATVETQHHSAPPLRRFVGADPPTATTVETQHHPGEAPPTATTVEFQQKDTHVNSVETQQWSLPLDPPGVCQDADCARRAAIGGYCEGHYGEYSRRYAGDYDYAADDD